MYVDGPILDMKYKSGVGALPIPVVHGLTMGEIAKMLGFDDALYFSKKFKTYYCISPSQFRKRETKKNA